MEARDLRDSIRFDPEDVTRETLFETDRLWAEVTCLDRNQTLGPISDDESDAIFTVVAGEAVFVVDRKRQRLKQWRTVLVPARRGGHGDERIHRAARADGRRGAPARCTDVTE